MTPRAPHGDRPRCATHPDREARWVAFARPASRHVPWYKLGLGGVAWDVCSSCARCFAVTCPRPSPALPAGLHPADVQYLALESIVPDLDK